MNGFIFDMDGTLMDSIRIWHEAEQKILDESGITLNKAERDELNALTLEEAGDFFHERFGVMESGQAVVDAIIDYMLAFYSTRAEANPGVLEFVSALHEAGAPMCVLSSSPQSFLQAGLAQSKLKPFFADDLIISVEDLATTKRDAETYEHVCAQLGCEPARTWFFDDSWYALATGREVGLRNVGVFSSDNCGTHEELARYADLVIDDFRGLDLKDFLS